MMRTGSMRWRYHVARTRQHLSRRASAWKVVRMLSRKAKIRFGRS